MRIPAATYRIQFRPEFTFDDAAAIVPYLKRLGISDLYSSPIFRSRRGSTHGYDVVDPREINPELGGAEGFDRLADVLREHDMGLLLDVVPNHMAASPENPWWIDLLEFGPESPYASFFDIDWTHLPASKRGQRVLLPILGRPYGEALEAGELKLGLDGDYVVVRYWEHVLPIAPDSLGPVLHRSAARLDGERRARTEGLAEIVEGSRDGLTCAQLLEWKKQVAALLAEDDAVRRAVSAVIDELNGSEGKPESFDDLDRILEDQWYRLAYWRTAGEAINYRRFFDVTDLVGVRVEDQQVFSARHDRMFDLVDRRDVTGLRIDHIDGLYDPEGYLRDIQKRTGGIYVLVEKILGRHERLRPELECAGTTGYDFLAAVSELFVDPAGVERLRAVWRDFTRDERSFHEIVRTSKKEVIATLFPGEMRALAAELTALAALDRNARDFTGGEIEEALQEVTAALDVYRSYVTPAHVGEYDEAVIQRTVEHARRQANASLDPRIFEFIERVLLVRPPRYLEDRRDEWTAFVMRWQQFTGRAMAKGVEDTTFYVHAPLLALNEVGGEPDIAPDADPLAEFHREMEQRSPVTMNATATHDTKRGEDARARLLVLSEMAPSFERRLHEWGRLNHPRKRDLGERSAPSRAEESIIYQSLLGAWPLDGDIDDSFRERFTLFVEKALRESKQNTSWIAIDEEYETAVREFVFDCLNDRDFIESLGSYASTLSWYGWINSLSQLVLRCTAPGVPDTYQGTEGWDFSLVDPDNRRPVDYATRARWIAELEGEGQEDLLDSWKDGRVKMHVLHSVLQARRGAAGEVLRTGRYIPRGVSGPLAGHLCAFERTSEAGSVLVLVPRLLATLAAPGVLPVGSVWSGAHLEVSTERWHDHISGNDIDASYEGGGILALPVERVLSRWPVAVLESRSSHGS